MTNLDPRSKEPRKRSEPECPWLESAALYVAGALAREDLEAFEAHLRRGCGDCSAELEQCAATLEALDRYVAETELARDPELAPDPALRAELLLRAAAPANGRVRSGALDRTWQRWERGESEETAPGVQTVRASDEAWESIGAPGIGVRKLAVDPERRNVTMLIRMAPGASYPAHRHAAREECYVISGSLHVAGTTMRAGDFQVADSGSSHDIQSTDEGCLLLIVSSQDDQLI